MLYLQINYNIHTEHNEGILLIQKQINPCPRNTVF